VNALLLGLLLIVAEPQKIVVPQVEVTGVEAQIGTIVTELILDALLNRHGVQALGPTDFKDMLNQEQQKQLLGCDQNSCMAEIAGAMGANLLISGMVGKLGGVHVVTLKLIDTRTARVTSRSSKRFNTIEEMPDAVGPLVDELLNAKPRSAAVAPALERLKEQKKRPATMESQPFCKRIDKLVDRYLRMKYDAALVAERRALLEDMMHTPYLQEFDAKVLCVKSVQQRVLGTLYGNVQAATKADEALDARRRRVEYAELLKQTELLEEAWKVGYEKEKTGAGVRPIELPFEIARREPPAPEDTEEVRRYLDDLESGQRVVAKALEAAKKKDRAAFDRLWTPEDPKRSRTSIQYVWDQLLEYSKNGYVLEPCPVFIIASSDVEKNARTLLDSGDLVACVRRKKADYQTTDEPYLRKTKSGWSIDRW
jgi:hypothetical protein